MTWWEMLLLFAAGVGGGLTGSIAGLASVSTYPALLMVGLPPVTANVTNTVALVFNAVGSVRGSLPELAGQGPQLKRLVPMACLGGLAGAVLLLSIPAEGFENVVPVLLAVASIAIALPKGKNADVAPTKARTIAKAVIVGLICIYGGFFGAAAGVLLLALFLRTGADTLADANATKNVVLGASNGVAAVLFAFVAPVHWPAVAAMGVGCLIGARLGPIVVRHAPSTPLRMLIAVAGLALAVKLGYDTYR
ncbi:sulfite exporter TauE/SafE family protein [Mycolicibacterium bacteremicum]|uniref:sulfite exporter TauE/SafE family protein n=1 Tax=Mycolicibacterium bacteremicum TaxID=564198 RepID=UPI0026F00093|nr:sulfite exporter TauE/SafE family protein [Mycolicibacterium bacteremicum]